MENRQLINYLQLVSDFPPERVKAALVLQGWSLEEIDAAFLQVQHERSVANVNTVQNTQIAMTTFSLFIVVAILLSSPSAVTGNAVLAPVLAMNDVQSQQMNVIEEVIIAPKAEEIVESVEKVSCISFFNTIERDDCFAEVAHEQSDVHACDFIKGEKSQSECVSAIAVKVSDPRICMNAKLQDDCLLNMAKHTRYTSACLRIANAQLYKMCLSLKE